MSKSTFSIGRRQLLQAGAITAASSLIPSFANASDGKIQIGYWPIASGLPFYVALEKGYFKEVGLNVEGVKFASPNQIAIIIKTGASMKVIRFRYAMLRHIKFKLKQLNQCAGGDALQRTD